MGTIFEYILAGLIIVAGIAAMIFHFKMLYDAFKHGEPGWGIFILFFAFFGSITYYFARYKTRSPFEKKY